MQASWDGDRIWEELKRGNDLYVHAGSDYMERVMSHAKDEWRRELVKGQNPIASVLSCADSRASPSLIFGCGQGDLFIIRNAGNVVGDNVLATLEFGLEHLKTRLLIILGHEKCGAIRAAMNYLDATKRMVAGELVELPKCPSHVCRLVKSLGSPVQWAYDHACRRKDEDGYEDEVSNLAVAENTRRSLATILRESSAIRDLVASGQVKVVLAEYEISTGRVRELSPETTGPDCGAGSASGGGGGGGGSTD